MAIPASEAPIASFTKTWHTDTYPAISPSRPELNLRGKNVFITGAGTGIGARTVESFAEAGVANIGVLARREQKLLETRDNVLKKYPQAKIHVYVGSVTDEAVVEKAFHTFAESSGGLVDIYINNAAAGDMQPLIGEINDTDTWFRTLEVNVKGSLITTQAFLRHAPKDAIIVNVSSFAGLMPFAPGVSAYGSSKAASTFFFRQLQFEKPELRVISIQPGVIKSEMNERGGFPAVDTAALASDFMVWLTSPEAKFLAGKYIAANFDVEEMKERAKEIRSSGLLETWLHGLGHKHISFAEM